MATQVRSPLLVSFTIFFCLDFNLALCSLIHKKSEIDFFFVLTSQQLFSLQHADNIHIS
jgi:hypothetical protein